MILEFLESWTLFSQTYISALLIGASLSLMGVVVVARGNIFVAAALALPKKQGDHKHQSCARVSLPATARIACHKNTEHWLAQTYLHYACA